MKILGNTLQFCASIMLAIPFTEIIAHLSGISYRNPDLPLVNNYGSIILGAVGLTTLVCGFRILKREAQTSRMIIRGSSQHI